MQFELNSEQADMLAGKQGLARQMAMRLLLDLAAMSGAERLAPIESAHLSGVSPLTGGLGLRLFLARLAADPGPGVAVPTTLNSAGCDEAQFTAMRIIEPDFLAHHQEIVAGYSSLGVRPILSCVPYEWEGILPVAGSTGITAAWAESNAICYANSYAGLRTNRESGLSALAYALTGYAPDYGLLQEDARRPNLLIRVSAQPTDPTDFSILGDWIGLQRRPDWRMPYGPIPLFAGLPSNLSHEQRKALSAAAANYGCPLLYLGEPGDHPTANFQAELVFGENDLRQRYEALRPKRAVSLVVLGCPQASIGELQAAASRLKGGRVTAAPVPPGAPPPLWIFTSAATKAIAEKTGVAAVIRESGALLLENTCPEVVPYDPGWVSHVLTNSMKAEHYIKSGLNGIPTSVMRLDDCIDLALGRFVLEPASPSAKVVAGKTPQIGPSEAGSSPATPTSTTAGFVADGYGLPSQSDYTVTGEALVADAPITFLGYVNRETGVIEEIGHPAHGQSLAGKIAIFPRGTGSSVAPYVLLELFYRGKAPIAVINTQIDQQTAPACSLEGIPYAYGFDSDPIIHVRSGDIVELARRGRRVTLRVIGPRTDGN